MTHTKGPWLDSPGASDAIISQDEDAIKEELGLGGPFTQQALDDYGGFIICESVVPNNKPLIKAAPYLYGVCKLWLGAVQNSLALRLALADLPEGAGPALIEMLQEGIAMADGETS